MDVTTIDVIQDVLQPNYIPLALLQSSGFLCHFLNILKRESKTLYVPNTIKRHILCLCIIACKMYSFNPQNITLYSDSMIMRCWQQIVRTVTVMEESYGTSQGLCKQILKNRNRTSYNSIAIARGVSNVVSLVKTSEKLLVHRGNIIESTRGLLVETSFTYPNPQLVFTNPSVYKSLYKCSMCYMGNSIN